MVPEMKMKASIRIATEAHVTVLRDALVLALAWRELTFPPDDPERYLRESGHGHLTMVRRLLSE